MPTLTCCLIVRALLLVLVTWLATAGAAGARGLAAGPGPAFVVQPEVGQPAEEIRRGYFWLHAAAGERRELRVAVQNTGRQAITLRAYPVDGVAVKEGGVDYSRMDQPLKDVGTWLDVQPARFTLAPGATQRVTATLRVPEGVGPGEHVGAIAVEDVQVQTQGAGSNILIDVHNRQVLGVVVAAPGPTAATAEIGAVALQPAERGSRAVLDLRNTGDVMLQPKGTIEVAGAQASARPVSFTVGTLLPGSRSPIPVDLPALSLQPGAYDVTVRLTTDDRGPLADWHGQVKLGTPTASEAEPVAVALAPAEAAVEAARDVSVPPITGAALAGLGLVAGALLARRGRRPQPATPPAPTVGGPRVVDDTGPVATIVAFRARGARDDERVSRSDSAS